MNKIPDPIASKLEELDALVEKNPLYIPIPKLSKFLGVTPDGLRASMEHGQCPFGFAWQQGANRGFKVPTIPFYLWYTQLGSFQYHLEKARSQYWCAGGRPVKPRPVRRQH